MTMDTEKEEAEQSETKSETFVEPVVLHAAAHKVHPRTHVPNPPGA